mgnify:CR=1 FL=1
MSQAIFRAERDTSAKRKISRLPRLAHKAAVMQAKSTEYCPSNDIYICFAFQLLGDGLRNTSSLNQHLKPFWNQRTHLLKQIYQCVHRLSFPLMAQVSEKTIH